MKAKQLYLFKGPKYQVDPRGKVYVSGYRRRSGTYVKQHWRKPPSRDICTRRQVKTAEKQLFLFENNKALR